MDGKGRPNKLLEELLKEIYTEDLPDTIESIDTNALADSEVSHVYISRGNSYYSTVNGTLFNKEKTRLIERFLKTKKEIESIVRLLEETDPEEAVSAAAEKLEALIGSL